jgi:hypothetical protein
MASWRRCWESNDVAYGDRNAHTNVADGQVTLSISRTSKSTDYPHQTRAPPLPSWPCVAVACFVLETFQLTLGFRQIVGHSRVMHNPKLRPCQVDLQSLSGMHKVQVIELFTSLRPLLIKDIFPVLTSKQGTQSEISNICPTSVMWAFSLLLFACAMAMWKLSQVVV